MNSQPLESCTLSKDPVTTFCQCWKMIRRDGIVRGYTDHDMPLTVAGVLCQPFTGLNASEARKSLGLAVDIVDIEGALSSPDIHARDISQGLLDNAIVETFLVNWRQPDCFMMTASAVIGRVKRIDGRFVAELESQMHSLDQPQGRCLTRACDAELGDSRCKVNVFNTRMRGTGEVSALEGPGLIRVGRLQDFTPGWFSFGILTWTKGLLAGRKVNIIEHYCQKEKVYFDVAHDHAGASFNPGDTFHAVAGCDKSFFSCQKKFDNALNFQGFPHLPGNDEAYAYANGDERFDGKPVIL